MERKIGVIIIIFMNIMLLQTYSYAKYKVDNTIKIAEIRIDKTPPEVKVQYKEIQIGKIIEITMISNEVLKPINGWISDATKKVWKRQISIIEELTYVEIEDLSGNKRKILLKIDNNL